VLKQGDSQRLYPLRTVFEAGNKGSYYAIQERENEIWLLDGLSEKEIEIDSGLYSSHTFAVDGKCQLLSTRITGHGVAIDPDRHRVKEFPEIPPGIVSTAGNLDGGFWLTDDFGTIYFTALDGACQKVSQVDLEIVDTLQLQSWPGLLLWSGLALHRTELGEDTVQVLVFFQPDVKRPGVLHKIGQRFFKLAHGRFQALACDPTYSRLLIVWYGGIRFEHSVKFGTVQDFIAEREDEKQIIDVDFDIIAAKVASGISGLYLLSKSGNLFLLDTEPLNEKRLDKKPLPIQAVLSGSAPLTGMAQGSCQNTSLALIEGGLQLCICEFERSPIG
jgi:hypothetical protein